MMNIRFKRWLRRVTLRTLLGANTTFWNVAGMTACGISLRWLGWFEAFELPTPSVRQILGAAMLLALVAMYLTPTEENDE
jgi:hypothetical protein